MTSGDGSVSSMNHSGSEDPPNKVSSEHTKSLAVPPVAHKEDAAESSTMEPLPLECTSGFDENLESSLVGMLLSPSLRKSFRKTARRCSNIAMSMLLHSTQTANNDLLQESSLIAGNQQDEALSLTDNLHHALMVDDDEPPHPATTKQQEDSNMEPLPITTSSDFTSHRSSLVGMLLSPSFFSESVKNTARRCSTALTCMLRNSILKVPDDDHASLFLADDLDGGSVFSGNDDHLSIDFEDIVAFDE